MFNNIPQPEIKTALHWSIVDGVLFMVMLSCTENFLSLFALHLHASSLQISLLQGIALCAITASQLLGARFLHRHGVSRKALSIVGVYIQGLSWIMIFIAGYLTHNVWLVLVFYFIGNFGTNFASPGWVSWMKDLVPKNIRGAFWGMRSRILGIAQFCTVAFAGILLHAMNLHQSEMIAFGLLFAIAGLSRTACALPLSKQYEPPIIKDHEEKNPLRFHLFLKTLGRTNFGWFAVFIFSMTFAVWFMAPLIIVYMQRTLGFDYLQIAIVNTVVLITSFLSMTYWGRLSDTYGNYRILYVTAAGLPLLALLWVFTKNFYLIILLQLLAGFIWAGFNLATANFIYDAIASKHIARVSAYFNSLNNVFAFLGAAAGGVIAQSIDSLSVPFCGVHNFELIFFISFVLRLVIVGAIGKKFTEVREVAVSPRIHYFYGYRPIMDTIGQFSDLGARLRIGKRPPDRHRG